MWRVDDLDRSSHRNSTLVSGSHPRAGLAGEVHKGRANRRHKTLEKVDEYGTEVPLDVAPSMNP
jgi:hypothetical protein